MQMLINWKNYFFGTPYFPINSYKTNSFFFLGMKNNFKRLWNFPMEFYIS